MTDAKYIKWKRWADNSFAVSTPGSKNYFDRLLGRYLKLNGCRVLEVGFGNGKLLRYLREQGCHVVGVEINEELIRRAKAQGYETFKGSVWCIEDLTVSKFDLIIAFDVAEHLSKADLELMFSWVRKHLCKDGKLILRFPEGSSPFGMSAQNGDFSHVSILTRSKVEALCNDSGMTLIDYKDDLLSSNRLCSWGVPGRLVLKILQLYVNFQKTLLKALLFPLAHYTSFAVNSIAVISVSDDEK